MQVDGVAIGEDLAKAKQLILGEIGSSVELQLVRSNRYVGPHQGWQQRWGGAHAHRITSVLVHLCMCACAHVTWVRRAHTPHTVNARAATWSYQ